MRGNDSSAVAHDRGAARRRPLRSLGGVAAAVALGAGALVAGSAGVAGAASSSMHGLTGVTKVNLQSAYLANLADVHTSKPSGIMRPHTGPPARPFTTTHPTTNGTGPLLRRNGGPVQHSAHLYLLLWGPGWTSTSKQSASASYLKSFLGSLGTEGATPDHWSTITSQYNDSSGHPVFSGPVLVGTYLTSSTPPHGATQTQLAAEAVAFATAHSLSNLTTVQVVVATQSGTCPTGFYGCGIDGPYCAWHSAAHTTGGTVPYTNLPYLPDANTTGRGCGADFAASSTPANEGLSIVEGHEYAETVTDPLPDSGYIDTTTFTGGEIGDKCAWSYKTSAVTFPGNLKFVVQPLFSNTARTNTGNGCVLSAGASATAPSKPAAPTAAPGNAAATVSWVAPATNGSPITKYTVTSSGGQHCTWTTGPLHCIIKKLTNGTSYTFAVKATNGVGTSPTSTPSSAVVPAGKPGKPAAPTATPHNGSATVHWTAAPANGSAITKYTVTSSGGQHCTWTTGPLTCTVMKLTGGTSYTFTVKATNAVGTGPASTPSAAVVVTAGKPGKPAPPTATAHTGSATVRWTAPATNGGAITGYTVVSSGGQRCVWTSGPLTCTVSKLTKGTSYTFKVKATNHVGTGPLSTPSNAVVPS